MSVVAVVPARGGSKGVPGKNLRELGGLPLVVHAIRCAALCPDIATTVVTTDDREIAETARAHGAGVIDRPSSLAGDESAMWPVVRHALESVDDPSPEVVVLLDPTSPARMPEDVAGALALLRATPEADGVVAVSEPEFNPIWTAVVSRDGWIEPLISGADAYVRRQDVPTVYRINAVVYAWRAEFVRAEESSWLAGRNQMYVVPEARAIHIDTEHDLARAQALLDAGLVRLPWLERRR